MMQNAISFSEHVYKSDTAVQTEVFSAFLTFQLALVRLSVASCVQRLMYMAMLGTHIKSIRYPLLVHVSDATGSGDVVRIVQFQRSFAFKERVFYVFQ